MSATPHATDVEWQVSSIEDVEVTITFDTEGNARDYWLANQPSVLKRTTSDHWLTDEVAGYLAGLEPATPAQEG